MIFFQFVQTHRMCNTKNEPLTVNLSDCDISNFSRGMGLGGSWERLCQVCVCVCV
jgi:hypothetical protein